jgi:hypothetical protein
MKLPDPSAKSRARGQTLEEFVSERLAKAVPPRKQVDVGGVNQAEQRFARWIGSVSLGRPTGADNDGIDEDLASGYANTHENGRLMFS